MKNKTKYKSFFTDFDVEHKQKFGWLLKLFLIIFIIACAVYLLVSIVAFFFSNEELETILSKIGELASILISMALSFITLFLSTKFEKKIDKLLNNIKQSNGNLNLEPYPCEKEKYNGTWLPVVSIVISVIIFISVIVNIILQLLIICGEPCVNIIMSKMIASIVLTLLTVCLSSLTIWDYIVLTNNMTIDLNDIEHQNHQLFNR